MKKTLTLLIILFLSMVTTKVWADTSNFHFSDFTADYYLTKGEDGISHLKVVENLTAVFPDYNQNKGICRQIPYTNQNGANTTLNSLTRDDITLLRNDLPEPIYSIEKYKGHYEVCTGTNAYVLGEQKYTFEYEFENVVTDYGDYQELYWDTNGNGWYQRFDKLTARLHFTEDLLADFSGKSWCYVGSYGVSGSTRCKITKIDDGVQFEAERLLSGENLTFDTEIKPGAFTIREPEVDYRFVFIMLAVVAICLIVLIKPTRNYLKTRSKAKYYNGLFVKPEYQPDKKHSIAEMAEIFIGKKKDAKVAVLLDMVVNKKISIVKLDRKGLISEKWAIIVNDVDKMRMEELILLTILAGGATPDVGDKIVIKTRSADASLVKLSKKYDSTILEDLKKHDMVENKYQVGRITDASSTVLTWIIMMFFAFPVFVGLMDTFDSTMLLGKRAVGKDFFWPVLIVAVISTIIIQAILKKQASKFLYHKTAGLDASRYMDGLKLYIQMAEADRLEMLQSVKGADVSPEGIVKLYEKLLPYAAVFGLEKSWMNEMSEYCKLKEIAEPDYLMQGITIAELSRSMRTASSAINSSTHYSSSSISGGGGFSSGSSGGGGGGFSGGGGGGGGGGGR